MASWKKVYFGWKHRTKWIYSPRFMTPEGNINTAHDANRRTSANGHQPQAIQSASLQSTPSTSRRVKTQPAPGLEVRKPPSAKSLRSSITRLEL